MPEPVKLADELIKGFPEATRASAQKNLEAGMSVYGYHRGKPVWVNPDGTITHSPKSCILAEPEE